MRSVRACALALSLVPAALCAADGVTLQNRPPQAGDVYKVISGGFIDFQMTIASGGQVMGPQAMSFRTAETYRVEVLEAEGMAPTRVRVRYLQSEAESSAKEDRLKKRAEAVAGKTFLVTASAEGPRVTDERGRPVDAETAEQVVGDANVGKPDRFCQHMAGRLVAVGETLDVSPEVAESLLGATSGEDEVEHLSLKLREATTLRGAPAAVFELQVRISSRMEDGTDMTFQAAGLATVSVNDCRPLSLEMSGPMTISGTSQEEGRTFNLRGTGRVKAVMRREYGR